MFKRVLFHHGTASGRPGPGQDRRGRWLCAPAPGSPNTAAFMVLRNEGTNRVKPVAGASPEAAVSSCTPFCTRTAS